jgi:hypothetical protein
MKESAESEIRDAAADSVFVGINNTRPPLDSLGTVELAGEIAPRKVVFQPSNVIIERPSDYLETVRSSLKEAQDRVATLSPNDLGVIDERAELLNSINRLKAILNPRKLNSANRFEKSGDNSPVFKESLMKTRKGQRTRKDILRENIQWLISDGENQPVQIPACTRDSLRNAINRLRKEPGIIDYDVAYQVETIELADRQKMFQVSFSLGS